MLHDDAFHVLSENVEIKALEVLPLQQMLGCTTERMREEIIMQDELEKLRKQKKKERREYSRVNNSHCSVVTLTDRNATDDVGRLHHMLLAEILGDQISTE